MLKRFLILTALIAGSCGAVAAQRQRGDRPGGALPRLVVLISIDQFRADYLTRFEDLYLPAGSRARPGGFQYLRARGAWYPDCQYEHHRTVTAAGHAILSTGAQPYLNGIVGNSWWDRATEKPVYCVADPQSRVVGALPGSSEKPMSAANLLVTTVGDELELATGGRSRTVSLSLKDRAAILLAGHRADSVVWFDEGTGSWISSSYYFPEGKLPGWVTELNARRIPARLRETPWTPAVDAAALERAVKPKRGSLQFSHPLTGRDFTPFTVSPAGNAFLFDSARQAVAAERLGEDEIPDILTLNLASNDYVGHRYGPDSPEVLDISVQTDRQLADFFRFLNDTVPGGLERVTIALSSDHGVATVPELHAEGRLPVARAVALGIRDAAEKALDAAVRPADWIAGVENGDLYFDADTLAGSPREPLARLEEIAAAAVRSLPGVHSALTRSDVLSGHVPRTAIGQRVSLGHHPERSGNVIVILAPHWLAGAAPVGTGTSHGTPFAYDTHVPLLIAGAGVRPGGYAQRVSPAQLAPTLSHVLGIARPGAADEPLLPGLEGLLP